MKRRAAIYARFSSSKQNERSCDDQIDLCRTFADRQADLVIVKTYKDEAISGASAANRPGLRRLMRDASKGLFDVVVAEDIDRLSRRQADLHSLRDRLAFLGIAIVTVSDGNVTTLQASFRALMSEVFLEELARKTRRGQAAAVRAGSTGGGRSYGYVSIPDGQVRVVDAEAVIVRRIFTEYAAGRQVAEIAAGLNADDVPAPRGGPWTASTILGNGKRQNGILQNAQYVGKITWNRQRFVKNPRTGRRVSKLNDPSDWLSVDAPELAIVDQFTFDLVQEQRAARSAMRSVHDGVRKHPFSGLLKCGLCGGGFKITNRDRLGCTRATCTNSGTVPRRYVEDVILEALERHLVDPEFTSTIVDEHGPAWVAAMKGYRPKRIDLESRIRALEQRIESIVDAILEGKATSEDEAQLPQLENEKIELERQLEVEASEAERAQYVDLSAGERNAAAVRSLRRQLQAGNPDETSIAAVRRMVHRAEFALTKESVAIDIYAYLTTFFAPMEMEEAPFARRPVFPKIKLVLSFSRL